MVLTNNDGCVAAASKPAIEVGIKKFAPYFQQKELIEKHGIAVFSSNYTLYSSISESMFNTLFRFGEGHVYSIDEAFLDLRKQSKLIPNMAEFCKEIRQTVWKETRLPVSIGVGPTLTLAKLANRMAKNCPNRTGVYIIDSERTRNESLQQSVSEVWGVGRRLNKRLNALGFKTAHDLAKLSPKQARDTWNVELERTVRELQGELCKHWDEVKADKQQIFSTRTTGKPITSFDELTEALTMHSSIAAKKLREQNSLVKTLYVFANNNDFHRSVQGIKGIHTFSAPTSDSTVIAQAMRSLVSSLYRNNIRYKRVGVGLIEIVSSEHYQLSLFEKDDTNPALMNVMDKLNNFYGRDTMFLASQGTKKEWAMKRNFLSPSYTTSWKELPIVQC